MPESTSNAPLIYIIPETERVFPGQRHPGTYAGDPLSAVKPSHLVKLATTFSATA